MEKNRERLQVIENIRKAVENKNFNSKVELHDHIVTDEEREKVILKYDSRKKKIRNKAKTIVARSITDSITDYVNIKKMGKTAQICFPKGKLADEFIWTGSINWEQKSAKRKK